MAEFDPTEIDTLYSQHKSQAALATVTSIDADPEKAAKSMNLDMLTGIPSSIINDDFDHYEQQHKSQMAAQLVQDNPHLVNYVNSHPLAASVSNDDWGNLSKVSEVLSKGNPMTGLPRALWESRHDIADVIKETVEGLANIAKGSAGIMESPENKELLDKIQELMLRGGATPEQAKIEAEHQQNTLYRGEALQSALFALPTLAISPAIGLFRHNIAKPLEQATGFPAQATEMYTMLGLAALGIKPLFKDAAAQQAAFDRVREVNRVLEPYIKAGEDPPVGLHPDVDKIIAEQSKIDLENLDDALSEATKSRTRERDPNLFADFIRLKNKDSLYIPYEAVKELYGDKAPHPEDKVLGWVDDIESKVKQAEVNGGDIEISVADWLAKVEPEVAKELRDNVRVRKGGVTVEEGKALSVKQSIDVYHGSPHEFDAFSMDKIGTGEGAQVYGHGLYFAEKPEVAKQYAHDLIKIAKVIKGELSSDTLSEGNTYRVRIKADKEQMLDWDTPIGEQPVGHTILEKMDSKLKQALDDMLEAHDQLPIDELTGNEFHQLLLRYASEDALPGIESNPIKPHFKKEVADYLKSLGIPGIKYLDQGSRGRNQAGIDLLKRDLAAAELAGDVTKANIYRRELAQLEPTSNYVIFDDSLVEILDRNGQAIKATRDQASLKTLKDISKEQYESYDAVGGKTRAGTWEDYADNIKAFIPKEFTKDEQAIVDLVDREIGRLVRRDISAQPAIEIKNSDTPKLNTRGVHIQYEKQLPIILYAITADDPIFVARHEAIHQLRQYGYITEAEWSQLREAALLEGWVNKEREGPGSSVAERYKSLVGEDKIEEAIADEFGYWKRHPSDKHLAAKVFEKIRKFLESIKEALIGLRSTNPAVEAIFAKIESGEIGSRKPQPLLEGVFQSKEAKGPIQGELKVTRQEDLKPFTPTALGMTKPMLDKYEKLIAKQKAEDIAYQTEKAVEAEKQRQTKEWKDNLVEVKKEVSEQVLASPEVAVGDFFRNGMLYGDKMPYKPKLDEKALTPEQKAELPKDLVAKNGISPDDAANLFGLSSAKELIDKVLWGERQRGETPFNEYVKRLIDQESNRRMEEKYGKLAENILAEAKDHVVGNTQMDILHEETLALGIRAGKEMTFTKVDVQAWVRDKFKEKITKSIDVDTFLNEAGRAGRAMEIALLKGDYQEAFKQKQHQYYSMLFAKEAKGFVKEQERLDSLFKRFAPREVNGVLPEYTNFIHDIMMKVGETVRRSVQDLQEAIDGGVHPTLKSFVLSKAINDYRQIPVADFLLDPNFRKPVESLSVDEFRALADTIKSLSKQGRDELKIMVAGKEADRQEVIGRMVEEIKNVLPDKGHRIDLPDGVISHTAKRYFAGSMIIESLFNRLDQNNPRGIFNQTIVRRLVEAANHEATLERKFGDAITKLTSIKELNKKVENTLFLDPATGEPLIMSRRNVLAVLQNAGNKENFLGLLRGYKIEEARAPEVFRWLFENTTKEDWNRAKALGKIFEDVKAMVDLTYRELTGVAPKNVETWKIPTPHGEYEGWYHPIIYDTDLPQKSIKLRGGDPTEQMNYLQTTPAAGYTKSRSGYTGPYLLNMDAFQYRLSQMIHDLSFREALQETSKIFNDESFKTAFQRHYGPQYSKLLDPFLKDVAGTHDVRSDAQNVAYKAIEFFRQNMISHLVGLNPGTFAKHNLTALMNSITEVGAVDYIKAQATIFGKNPDIEGSNWTFAMNKSEELQRRHRNYLETVKGSHSHVFGNIASSMDVKSFLSNFSDRPLSEGARLAVGDFKAKYLATREMLMWIESAPLAAGDLFSAVPTWMAQYKKSKGSGADEGLAVFEADRAVRRAHGSTAITNRPSIMRSNPFAQTFSSFYGFFNHILNRQYEMAWAAKGALKGEKYYSSASKEDAVQRPNILDLVEGEDYAKAGDDYKSSAGYKAGLAMMPVLAGMMVSYVIWPAFVEELVQPLHSDPNESKAVHAAKVAVKGLSSSWLIIRDVAHAMIEGGDVTSGLIGTGLRSALSTYRDITKPNAMSNREKQQKFIKDANGIFGLMFGLTNQSVVRMSTFASNVYTGTDQPIDRYSASKTARQLWRGITTGSSKERKH